MHKCKYVVLQTKSKHTWSTLFTVFVRRVKLISVGPGENSNWFPGEKEDRVETEGVGNLWEAMGL